MPSKITMKIPLVEIDGDEMTRILWALIKEKLILPFVDLKLDYYDLSIQNRDADNDKVTHNSAQAILKYGVGVKCATITANEKRKTEYKLKNLYPSPNATIRATLDGTVFRKPINISCVKPSVVSWKKPIIIGRHAYGDVYKNAEMKIDEPGKVELVYTKKDGSEKKVLVADMKSAGIVQGIHNFDDSIRSFSRSCFRYALTERIPVWFAAKDTISQIYDARFKTIFNDVYENEYKTEFEKLGLSFYYTLIDDAVARLVRDEGGFLWACKNYDGDVFSDLVASASGSLAMMTSVLVSPNGVFEYEAAHGTVQRHYYRYMNGEKTSTNPTALIFAWTGALSKRAEFDNIPSLDEFSKQLEKATLDTIENGFMTSDLARLSSPEPKKTFSSWEFIDEIAKRLS